MQEGKSPIKKRLQIGLRSRLIEIIFPERVPPHPDKYSLRISYENLPEWPEMAEEDIIRSCLCHAIFMNF